MFDNVFHFLLLGLASFRLTRLIVFDKITEFLRSPFFDEVEEEENGVKEIYFIPKKDGLKGWIGELLSCYWCIGVWVSIILVFSYYFIPSWSGPVITVLAVAGLASFFETAVQNWLKS
ncbi:DUF1360 domain-containing protein [Peribacillus tepidiphilus]|jgi:hypothetical protein|uniref:DUF1360 domain-containing protein n=1 Tax=Peribacillus tepidiphilus TaxID=2652445 RepID=UPI001291625A|nr:DUF1360 domain-containing protein [Peribacillus tepidiphilus]